MKKKHQQKLKNQVLPLQLETDNDKSKCLIVQRCRKSKFKNRKRPSFSF